MQHGGAARGLLAALRSLCDTNCSRRGASDVPCCVEVVLRHQLRPPRGVRCPVLRWRRRVTIPAHIRHELVTTAC